MNKAIELANSIEDAEMQNRVISSSTRANKSEEAIEVLNMKSGSRLKCYRCDSDTHLANKCRIICNKCNKVGHMAKVCRSRRQADGTGNTQCHSFTSTTPTTPTAEPDIPNIEEEIYHIHALRPSNTPYCIKLNISETFMEFEIEYRPLFFFIEQ